MACYAITERGTGDVILVLEGASFHRALEHAARAGARLARADLKGARLASAFLFRAGLEGADLNGADLAGAYLREADLRGSDLRGSALTGAFLKGADARGADLRGANLAGSDLRGSRLVGADLAGANLDRARLTGAVLDWRGVAVVSELLSQDLRGSRAGRLIILDLMVHDDEKPYSWLDRLLAHEARTPALTALARRVRPGDNAPQILRRLSAMIPMSPRELRVRGAA